MSRISRHTRYLLEDAIEAVIDARNHAPLMHTQRDILFKLTLRLHEEGFFDHKLAEELKQPDQPRCQ